MRVEGGNRIGYGVVTVRLLGVDDEQVRESGLILLDEISEGELGVGK